MSLNNDGQSCALCHAYLFPEDDVVYCPECGAPHHRECYNSIGKCALEELHGTDRQYDKLKKASEEKQAEQENAQKQYNHNSYETPFGTMSQIDFLGGVKPEEEIDEGVTAKEAAKFVLTNTMRYIPKFKRLRRRKASWNFLAFIFPCGWYLSRKMYWQGIVAGVLQIVATLLTIPFQNALINSGVGEISLQSQLTQEVMQSITNISPLLPLVAFLGGSISIAVSVLSGIFGDYIYKKHAISSIKEINANSEDKEVDFRKKGGVNIFLFLIGFFALQYITTIIMSLM